MEQAVAGPVEAVAFRSGDGRCRASRPAGARRPNATRGEQLFVEPDEPAGWTGLTWTPPCGLKSLRLRIAIAARHKNINRSRQDSFNIIARYLLSLDLDPRARQILARRVVTRE
jgi:hypothetical protein